MVRLVLFFQDEGIPGSYLDRRMKNISHGEERTKQVSLYTKNELLR